MNNLKNLLSPCRIGNLEISNRIVMPPMGTRLANDDGTVSDETVAYLKRRAKSGAGLIITEIVEVHPLGVSAPKCLGVWDDRFIPGLKRLADAVHQVGPKVAMQLHHCGRESYEQTLKKTAVAPSAIPSYVFGFLGAPREMSLDDIRETITSFGQAARRAKEAGFDMVELHGAHGYLLMQFLSAHSNQRTDEYGGDFKKRSRFVVECVEETRKQVGPDYPISIRISGEEQIKNGYTIEDMASIMPQLVKAGANMIHVSFGTHGNAKVLIDDTPTAVAPIEYAPGFKSYLARRVKDVTNMPVVAVGRFTDPAVMDEVIARGDADLVAVGRQHLADPDFLKNYLEGHSEDTLECLACNQGCIDRVSLEAKSIRCAINPETGQELIYPQGPTVKSQQVWVIGAGSAGLMAASEAARLGHSVVLFEKGQDFGGHVKYAAMAPFKTVYGKFIDTLLTRCRKFGVTIKMGTKVTDEMIEKANPDVVILATGSDKTTLPVDGVKNSIVCDAWQILSGEVQPKESTLIIGAGLVGLETADAISHKGIKKVTVVEGLAVPPVSHASAHGYMLYKRLEESDVKIMFNTLVKKIEDNAVIVSMGGEERRIEPISQVIVAIGVTPRKDLKEILQRKKIRHFIVGDAKEARRIIEATTEGAAAAWNI